MQFVRRDVWYVTFLEPGLQTPLPKTLTFRDEGKIREGPGAKSLANVGGSADGGLCNSEGGGRCVPAIIARSVRAAETAMSCG
jgi:hypothetical protein